MSALQFQVGKRFKARCGAEVMIVRINALPAYRFLVGSVLRLANGEEASSHKMTFCPDGRYWLLDEPHDWDLVSEVP